MASENSPTQENWYHHFTDFQYSSKAFYDKLIKIISEQSFPNVKMDTISYSEGGILSAKRQYLYIKRNEYRFDVCAAPFGKGFFISWWLTEAIGFLPSLLIKIPYIGEWLATRAQRKTFYQVDSQTMFKAAIHSLIVAVVDDITEPKGIRLSESERKLPGGREKP